MDKTTISEMPVYRSEVFRTPFRAERAMGLWTDRVGEAVDTAQGPLGQSKGHRLRLLGLHGAVLVEKGTGWFLTASRGRIRIRPGMVMLLFPEEPHTYFPDTQWTTRWVVWTGPEAAVLESVGYLTPGRPVVRDRLEVLVRTHAELAPLMGEESLDAVLRRKELLLRLIHDLYIQGRAQGRGGKLAGPVSHAVGYIQGHYTEPITVVSLAARVHLSPTHFRRLFRQHTGRSPQRYITSLRISAAKRLLAAGRTIKETASAVGFDDQFYFMRVFKQEAGSPPGAFIKSLRR